MYENSIKKIQSKDKGFGNMRTVDHIRIFRLTFSKYDAITEFDPYEMEEEYEKD